LKPEGQIKKRFCGAKRVLSLDRPHSQDHEIILPLNIKLACGRKDK
jgi:hypothetical protein